MIAILIFQCQYSLSQSIDNTKKRHLDRISISIKAGTGWNYWKYLDHGDIDMSKLTLETTTRFRDYYNNPSFSIRYFTVSEKSSFKLGFDRRVFVARHFYHAPKNHYTVSSGFADVLLDYTFAYERYLQIREGKKINIRSFLSVAPTLTKYFNHGHLDYDVTSRTFIDHPDPEIVATLNTYADYKYKKEGWAWLTMLKFGGGLIFDFKDASQRSHAFSFEIYYTQGFIDFYTESVSQYGGKPTVIATKGSGFDIYFGYHFMLGDFIVKKKREKEKKKYNLNNLEWYGN